MPHEGAGPSIVIRPETEAQRRRLSCSLLDVNCRRNPKGRRSYAPLDGHRANQRFFTALATTAVIRSVIHLQAAGALRKAGARFAGATGPCWLPSSAAPADRAALLVGPFVAISAATYQGPHSAPISVYAAQEDGRLGDPTAVAS